MTQPALVEHITAQPVPEILPSHIREACAGQHVQFKVHKGLRECMQVPENISVSDWADKYRRVTAIDAYPGRWRSDLVPHTKRIMDVIGKPYVKEVWMCMVERSAKTQVLLNAAMHKIDRGIDSGNIFWLMPSENEAKKALGERIIPSLKESPRTARLLSRYSDDTTRTMVRFKHGPRLFPAWPTAAAVSGFFGALNIADEIDKMDLKGVGTETDILTLFRKRGRDRDDSKFIYASTPAGKYIYKGMKRCQLIIGYFSKCPHCGELILMSDDHFDIPADVPAQEIADGLHEIAYACNANSCVWDEHDRKYAYEHGDWYPIELVDDTWQLKTEGIPDRPVSVGVHGPSYPLPNIPMTEIAAAIRRAENGTVEEKKDLEHGYKAVDYEHEEVAREEDEILVLCDDRPTGIVPSVPLAALLLTIDTQADHFWYVLRAHGYGMDQESWQVRCGQLQSFEAIERMMYETEFFDGDGKPYRVTNVAIDTGGTKRRGEDHSRTYQVYDWARNHPMVYPFKGAERQAAPFRVSNIDFFPGTNKAIPGGLQLYNVNANYYKDELDRRLRIQPTDPGAFHLHCGFEPHQLEMNPLPPSNLREYSRHMVGETRDDRGQWQPRHQRRHDLWDCEVYQIALADILDLRYIAPPGSVPAQPQRKKSTDSERKKSKSSNRRW